MTIPSPSQVLIDQTTTALPSAVSIPLVFGTMSIALYRILIIRDRRPTTTAANWYGFWILVYAATRIPEVQQILLAAPGATLSDVRVVGSTADIAAAVSLFLLALRWRSRSGLTPRWVHYAAWLFVLLAGTALVILDMPARAEGISIEEVGGWRFAAYATLYSGPFIPAEGLIVVTLVQMVRERSSRARKILVTCLMAAIGMSVISLSTRVLGSWLAAAGFDTSLSHFRSAVENDVAFYASVLWLIPAAAPLVVADLRRRAGFERRDEREIERLFPLWSDLTRIAPTFKLAEMHAADLPSLTEQIHRMHIEIEDIVRAVAVRLEPDMPWPADPAGRSMMLRMACECYIAGVPVRAGTEPPSWLADETAVCEVADSWSRLEVPVVGEGSELLPHPANEPG